MKAQLVRTMNLAGGAVVPFSSEPGKLVRVVEGRVWLTEQGNLSDFFLSGGEEAQLGTRGLAVLEAFDSAKVQVIDRAGAKRDAADSDPTSTESRTGAWERGGGQTLESAAFLPAIVSAIVLIVLVGLQELGNRPAASSGAEPLAQLNAQPGLIQRIKMQAGRTGS